MKCGFKKVFSLFKVFVIVRKDIFIRKKIYDKDNFYFRVVYSVESFLKIIVLGIVMLLFVLVSSFN